MTRIIIFSDLHANWEAWLALQQAEPRPDAVLCLGDTVGYGPDPKRCLDSVRRHTIGAIRGRHDGAVGAEPFETDHYELADTWRHARSTLSENDHHYLRTLPAEMNVTVKGVRFYIGRLSPDDGSTETFSLITAPTARLQALIGNIEADIIFLGGPHVPAMRQVGGRLIVCPGSLGLPRYGVSDPTFAAWEDGRVQIHHLHYHPDTTIRKLLLLPLDPEQMMNWQAVLKTGRDQEWGARGLVFS